MTKRRKFEINWVEVELNGVKYPRAAMLFSVQVLGCSSKATVQMDTGAGESYATVPKSYNKEFVELDLDGRSLRIPVSGKSSENEFSVLLGTNELKDLYISIDFKRDKISFSDSSNFNVKISYINIKPNKNNRILLELGVGRRLIDVMLDTGASMFELSSTESLASSLFNIDSHKSNKLVIPAGSWADAKNELVMNIYNLSGQKIEFGSYIKDTVELSLHNSKHPAVDFGQYDPKIFGLIGLKFFSELSFLVIDMKNRKIGISK